MAKPWQRPRKPKRIDSPEQREKMDRYLEKFGLLNYQTEGLSSQEIADRYARARVKVRDDWAEQNYGTALPEPSWYRGPQQPPTSPAQLAPSQSLQVNYGTAPNGLLVKSKTPTPSGKFQPNKPLTQLQIAAGYGYEPTQYDTGKINAPATVQDALSGNANWSDVEINQREKVLSDPAFYETGQIMKYPKWMQQQILADPAFNWERLPKWQKLYYELSSSPAGMGAAQGALMGLGGGPVGGVAGGAIGGGLGYVAGKSGYDPLKEAWQQKGFTAKTFGWLNFLAEQAEKGVGIGVQTFEAAINPDVELKDVWTKEGWHAGAITYEMLGEAAADTPRMYSEWFEKVKGGKDPRVAAAEIVLDRTRGGFYTNVLGSDIPVQTGMGISDTFEQARKEIAGGRNYREVMLDLQNSVAAQLYDMGLQAAADPLNVLPRVETKVLGKVADVTGNKVAAEALKGAAGPMEAARTYKTLVQTGQAVTIDPAFRVDTMGAFSRFVAGINEQGQVVAGPFTRKGLLDAPAPKRNLAGFVQEMATLTPQSRAQIGANMFYENIGALLTRFDDPHEAGKYLKALANSDMETWKELGTRFADSPEFYTVLPALKDYNAKGLDGIIQTWDMSAPNRDALTRIANVLGDNPSKLLDDLAARGTADQDFQRIVQRLQQSNTPEARAILDDIQAGRFTPDSLRQIVDVFTGDGALPWHPGQWKAMMLDSLGSHFDEWVTNRLMLDQTPEAKSAFFRTASLMKSAQSILLLGASPGYAITNGLSNMVHRAASGVFGYLTPNQINGWMDRFGATPARFEEGVGIGGMVEQTTGKSAVKTEAQQKAIKGKGALADAKDKLNKLSRGMPFSKLSSWFEKNEGRQAFSIAMRQFWSQSWRRGTGFRTMDPQLTRAIQGMEVDPNRIYAAIEAGMNQGEIEKALYGRFEGVQTRSLVDDAARRTGLTSQQAADLLEKVGVLDTLDSYLKGQTTRDGIQAAFRRGERVAQDWLDMQTGEDLKAIAEHVRQKVGLEGAASGLDVVQRVNSTYFDAWMDHFFRLGEVMDDLSTLDDPKVRSKAIEAQYSISDAEFRRINARTGANYQGIFDAWGKSGNPKAMEMLAAIAQSDAAMKQAYDFMRTERRQFFQGNRPIEEWSASQDKIDAEFSRAFKAKHDAEVRMGESLGKLYEEMYGPAAGEAARKWWEDVTAFNDDIVKREKKARQEFAQLPKEQREAARQKYYRETKIMLIAEAEKINEQGIARLERVIRKGGGRGQAGAPPQPTPQPVPPTEGPPSPAIPTRLSGAEEINGLIAEAEQRTARDLAARSEQVNSVWDIAEGYTREGEPYNRAVVRDRFALLGALRKKEYGGIKDLTGLDDPRLTPDFIRDVMEKRAQIKAGETPVETPTFDLPSWQKDFDNVVQRGDTTRMIDLFESFPPERAGDLAPTGETWDAFMVRSWEETAARVDENARDKAVAESMARTENAIKTGEARADAATTRNLLKEKFEEVFDLTDEQASAYMELSDALAGWYERTTGENADTMYSRYYEDVVKGGIEDEGLQQGNYKPEDVDFGYTKDNLSEEYRQKLEDKFEMYSDGNEGAEFDFIESNGEPIAFMQRTGNRIYYLQSLEKGAGKTLVDRMKLEFGEDGLVADNVLKGAERFWEAQGFKRTDSYHGYGAGYDWEWYPGDTSLFQSTKGAVTFDADGIKATIHAFESKDFSTLIHENGHVFRRVLKDVAERTGNTKVQADLATIEEWAGVKDGNWTRKHEEKFARGFEKYIAEGKAPTPKLRQAFESFKNWMLEVYQQITGSQIDIKLTDDVRAVFDRMLGADEAWGQFTDDNVSGNRLRDYGMGAPESTLARGNEMVWRDASGRAVGLVEIDERGVVDVIISSRVTDQRAVIDKLIEVASRATDIEPEKLRAQIDRLGVKSPLYQTKFDIPLNQARRAKGVEEITSTEFFKKLQQYKKQAKGEDTLFQDADQPVGSLDAASQFTPHSEAMDQGWGQFVRPLLSAMEEGAVNQLNERPLEGAVRDMSPEGQAQLRKYMKQVQGDMATSKLATMRYGEQQRDFAMLNYPKQYGFDRWIQVGYPYEFFYTRSLATWGARGIDAPAWFSNYARLKMQQQRYERDIPERLRNKIKIPAPWLPDWMGDSLYIDPLSNLFTPAQFLKPFERMEQDKSYQEIEAERILQEWAEDGTVSQNELQQAAQTRSGSAWERAFAEAQMRRESEIANPMDFFSTMFGPAWYLSAPLNMAGIKVPGISKGDPNKVGTLPLTNTARALDTVTQGSWAEPVGDVIGLLGKPEEWVRKKAGLPTLGEYGEYYTKRQVANMVAEGLITSEDAQLAMIEKQGPIWDQATQRVQMELALRVPTMGAIYAGLHEGPGALAQAALPSLFGSGLLPEGELEYRGLKQEWNEAWRKYDAGDKTAVNNFFDEHPEYEAYLAKGKGDDELMKSFMIGQIWDGYMALGPTNQKQARAEMGELFQQAFLDKETRSYESIDTDTLIQWAQQLNKKIPQAVNAQPLEAPAAPKLDLYSEDVTRVTDEFFQQRTKYHSDYYQLEQGYYALPKSKRASYLLKNPELKEYWEWKDKWFKSYPELEPIFRGQVFKTINTDSWPPGLLDYVNSYAYTGQPLPRGASKALEQVWIMEGRPYGDMKTWLNSQVAPALLYGNNQ